LSRQQLHVEVNLLEFAQLLLCASVSMCLDSIGRVVDNVTDIRARLNKHLLVLAFNCVIIRLR
jgi:hypothetical protein